MDMYKFIFLKTAINQLLLCKNDRVS